MHPQNVVAIGLLVVTVEIVLGKALLQGDQCDRSSTGKDEGNWIWDRVPILVGKPGLFRLGSRREGFELMVDWCAVFYVHVDYNR